MIVIDLAEFALVIFLVVFMFSEMFFILNAEDDTSGRFDLSDPRPFYSQYSSAMR